MTLLIMKGSIALGLSDVLDTRSSRSPSDSDSPHLTRMSPRRRREYLAGRKAARIALYGLTGVEPGIIDKASDGAPVPPKGTVVSISHTDKNGIAIAAFSRNYKSIGIDIQSAGTVSRQVLESIQTLPKAASPCTYDWETAWFSAAEAAFKALTQVDSACASLCDVQMIYEGDNKWIAVSPQQLIVCCVRAHLTAVGWISICLPALISGQQLRSRD